MRLVGASAWGSVGVLFIIDLRVIRAPSGGDNLDRQVVYLLRELTGNVHILSVPEDPQVLSEERVLPMPDSTGSLKIN
jgi:hypothetical protein